MAISSGRRWSLARSSCCGRRHAARRSSPGRHSGWASRPTGPASGRSERRISRLPRPRSRQLAMPAARAARATMRLPPPTPFAMSKKKKKIEARLSPIHGNGVFATELIRKGERIVRYKGKLRSHAEVDEEYGDDDEDGHTFLFTLNDDYVVDANVGGNVARWINHSCQPNCESEIEEDAKDRRHKDKVFIHALREIKPGEELTY